MYTIIVTTLCGILFCALVIQSGFMTFLLMRLNLIKSDRNEIKELANQSTRVLAQRDTQLQRLSKVRTELELRVSSLERDLNDAESRLPRGRNRKRMRGTTNEEDEENEQTVVI